MTGDVQHWEEIHDIFEQVVRNHYVMTLQVHLPRLLQMSICWDRGEFAEGCRVGGGAWGITSS